MLEMIECCVLTIIKRTKLLSIGLGHCALVQQISIYLLQLLLACLVQYAHTEV